MPKFLKLLTLLFCLFLMLPEESQAQFKDKGPKSSGKAWSFWKQKQHQFNGYKFNSGQRKALGMKNGLLGTGLFANKSKKKKPKTKLSNQEIADIRKNQNQPLKSNKP
ncbi:hypothetical protein [Algoriphagus sp.]|uniref:hypothetical protein n=1 Tax=Algoriphagus sp. TaxID=1872435 RepID=UPI00257BD36E|nr:hypothetical protein [Algoriphagus sp.]|tara:strand:- start:10449 stop:10772 length:324 start_codon:yes stop_codon:yes gene_type:complete